MALAGNGKDGRQLEPPAPPTPEQKRVGFFGRAKWAQVVLAFLTFGLWLLVPLTSWLWRTGRKRGAYVVGGVSGFFVLVVALSLAFGDTKSTPEAKGSTVSTVSRTSPTPIVAASAPKPKQKPRPTPAPAPKPTPAPAHAQEPAFTIPDQSSDAPNERTVSRADYGNDWPLTVESGTLRCDPPSAVTFTTEDRTTYWINGTAASMADGNGWLDVEAIWADDPDPTYEGLDLKISIGPLIDDGLTLCD